MGKFHEILKPYLYHCLNINCLTCVGKYLYLCQYLQSIINNNKWNSLKTVGIDVNSLNIFFLTDEPESEEIFAWNIMIQCSQFGVPIQCKKKAIKHITPLTPTNYNGLWFTIYDSRLDLCFLHFFGGLFCLWAKVNSAIKTDLTDLKCLRYETKLMIWKY